MKVLIVGAGRMGIRHAIGALKSQASKITLTDISEISLQNAKNQLQNMDVDQRLDFELISDDNRQHYDAIIFATTAKDRIGQFKKVLVHTPTWVLFEKPLGQNFEEVQTLVSEVNKSGIRSFVNLNMRMYGFINKLKEDLDTLPQFSGIKNINFSGGALGISANGIHYIDLLFFLYGGSRAVILGGEIDDQILPSGRGEDYGDYGGWMVVKFFDHLDNLLGNSYISLSSNSSVFGGWDIIGINGRIRVNELEGERIDILRDPNSVMPINRYAAEYLPPLKSIIESPYLGDLTFQWLQSLGDDSSVLPSLNDSILSHKLLFEWLSMAGTNKRKFLIT